MNIRDIKDIEDVKKYLAIIWGAITTFQDGLYSITGNIEEMVSIQNDIASEIHNLIELLTEMRKSNMDDKNKLEKLIEQHKKHQEEIQR